MWQTNSFHRVPLEFERCHHWCQTCAAVTCQCQAGLWAHGRFRSLSQNGTDLFQENTKSMVAGTLALFKFRPLNYCHWPWILDGVDMSHLCQPIRCYSLSVRWNRFRRPIATNAAISTCTLGISYGNAAAGGDWNLCEGNTLENY